VERDRVAIGCLQRNAEALGVGKRHRVHAIDASAGLDPLPACDVLFCDPPFPWFVSERDLLSKVIDGAGRHLATEGCLLLRGERGHSPPPWPDFLQEESRRNYGRSWVAVLTLAADS
jgi:16S rRNA G966 N2-methylase RsmD